MENRNNRNNRRGTQRAEKKAPEQKKYGKTVLIQVIVAMLIILSFITFKDVPLYGEKTLKTYITKYLSENMNIKKSVDVVNEFLISNNLIVKKTENMLTPTPATTEQSTPLPTVTPQATDTQETTNQGDNAGGVKNN